MKCVCGGDIQTADDVRLHNMSLTHVVWRAGREEPTAVYGTDDVSRRRHRTSAPPEPSLGPCDCQGCGRIVWWGMDDSLVRAWRDADGSIHACAVTVE